jgi:hypothetical protein
MIDARIRAADLGARDVDVVCRLNERHELDALAGSLHAGAQGVASEAVLACLGSRQAHDAVLRAVTSAQANDATLAQAYLRRRPIVEASELRSVALRIAEMHDANAQVRALDTLAENPVSDVQSLESLVHLFPSAKSIGVQRAIAGILIRSDYQAVARPEVVRALREKRLRSPDGQDLIDILIRRMQASLGKTA